MFTPDPIRLGLVVNSCQIGDFFWSYLQPKRLSEPVPNQNNCTARRYSRIISCYPLNNYSSPKHTIAMYFFTKNYYEKKFCCTLMT